MTTLQSNEMKAIVIHRTALPRLLITLNDKNTLRSIKHKNNTPAPKMQGLNSNNVQVGKAKENKEQKRMSDK